MSATRRPYDRDDPCQCGGLAYYRLADGSVECVSCGRVTTSEVSA